ncbi:hypothetical protein MLD38_011289 [Melastoma candidum]|uniref:Uncharacterized protein n=1 Tax=Melastoma candidum TaxID=119954 RepID=A0ACB9R349_9MYRT|nr:hypothetical protein MLD38_011289 [Melastoma candidum]
MAAVVGNVSTVGISETFERLKKEGKVGTCVDECATLLFALNVCGFDAVPMLHISGIFFNVMVALIPFITAGDPDLPTTAKALKLLDSCGSDIIELGVPYSDPLADGPVIQAAATRSLAKGTTFDSVILMLKEVVPHLSCPIALFSYYNPILKRGVQKFMSIIHDAGVHGLVDPDVPLEETEILREEASKHKIELVLLTTPTTPTSRMKSIVEASEGKLGGSCWRSSICK